MENKTKEPAWLQRVREEKKELYIKIEKLTKFLGSETKPHYTQESYLREQLETMWRYHDILSSRISAYESAKKWEDKNNARKNIKEEN